MPRYVILLHEMPPASDRATHWDLMLEWGDVLRTWALAQEPAVPQETQAVQLSDHRKDYLEYEGPVSNQRGTVARWDEGQYRVEQDDAQRLIVTLMGRRWPSAVRLVLQRSPAEEADHLWTVSFSVSSEPTRG